MFLTRFLTQLTSKTNQLSCLHKFYDISLLNERLIVKFILTNGNRVPRSSTLNATKTNSNDKRQIFNGFNNESKSKYSNAYGWICGPQIAFMLNIFALLGLSDNNELDPESELIMVIKRAILATSRDEFEKAEKLLHLALRMVQNQGNELGITYVFDTMANLAYQRGELNKAKTLFVNVMQRLLSAGAGQDDPRILHISIKLAHINFEQNNYTDADLGYKFVLDKLDDRKIDTVDLKQISAMVNDRVAQLRLAQNKPTEAIQHLQKAIEICSEIEEQSTIDGSKSSGGKSENLSMLVLLLNDLGSTHASIDNFREALKHLRMAKEKSLSLPSRPHLNVINANIGLVYLKQGMINEARDLCGNAWRLAKKDQDLDGVEVAQFCLDELRKV